MKLIGFLTVLFLAAFPAAASDALLYQRLTGLEGMAAQFSLERTATGIDFNSKQQVVQPGGMQHPRYHIEIEGRLPTPTLSSLPDAAEAVAAAIAPEVDQTQAQENPILPGINVDFVDINGVVVAILSYRARGEDQPFRRHVVIRVPDGIYTATMTLHSASEKDPFGLYLMMIVVRMIDSGEIDGLRA